jgi:hypothetical protein
MASVTGRPSPSGLKSKEDKTQTPSCGCLNMQPHSCTLHPTSLPLAFLSLEHSSTDPWAVNQPFPFPLPGALPSWPQCPLSEPAGRDSELIHRE